MGNEMLGDLIVTIYKNLKTRMERDLKQFDIGMGQMQILMVFFSDVYAERTQSDLVKEIGVDKGNISRSLVKLLDKGYVEQNVDNKKNFRLTEKGIGLKTEVMTIFIGISKLITNDINENELNKATMTLSKISTNLEGII